MDPYKNFLDALAKTPRTWTLHRTRPQKPGLLRQVRERPVLGPTHELVNYDCCPLVSVAIDQPGISPAIMANTCIGRLGRIFGLDDDMSLMIAAAADGRDMDGVDVQSYRTDLLRACGVEELPH